MKITRRQRDVVALIDAGLSCPKIAVRLEIELNTVRRHVRDIGVKLREAFPEDADVPALRHIRKRAGTILHAA